MKFKISQSDFSKTLSAASRSILTKANLPILSNVLISASRNKLEILSTNLETATKASISCKTEIEGKITIPGRTLLEFISQLPEGEVTFEKLGEEVLVSTKGYNARIPTIAPEEFPAIPKIEKGYEVKIKTEDFVKGVDEVAFCAAQDEGRPILTGVLCEFKGGKLSLVATDGYRLSFREIPIEKSPSEKNIKIVVPARAISEVAKVIVENIEGETGDLSLVVADSLNQINFKVANVEFTSRLIEGEFPGWQKIIPSSFTTKARLPKSEFIKLVRIAAIFARDSGNIVRLKLESAGASKKGALTVLSSAAQVGSTDAQIEAEMTGKGGEIAFNFRYLLEVLSIIGGEEVNFEMIESLNPGRITATDEKDSFFHIIMPVRLQV
ncbi:DNA polymerase III subunit beta [Candidatus Curtissbacteria bacterium RIFCSPHIGHO2_12_41_11]|uniref:Beta sliding clamp n=3 Tax=Candidatus Curtissiibacteriota TaxID=1752717 RepID=A0A1F5HTN6_9BACT|nr:MAG: polymerase III subunit beta protein [Candidatus Curtissbacteria bacterium GW2011_GWA2_41_24]OGD88789.1 MAG: DNA polymerase III subunit beta [Candidatus Curtissbacteria bacterium RIFCSPHIGHO2_02_39_8]OGD97993.1 MAG: DNA polymerase III subunit beta [Candidatus Curtissbacteria bacterium RIFCSPHIGHO2_12_41_11]OGE07446.1 MAG: DNA polymerase III subunit beta [Candidatus Curtissbacteria bacterium RIFCSPLOWO2_02_41_11]